jgi:glucose-1-phosphate thymidylyltransferase
MKGIVLAGGTGSRLWPSTIATCKQLIPIYDKPMIFYPLSTLMSAGVREILIICAELDLSSFEKLLGNGSSYGISITYKVQPTPDGIAQAYILAEDFLDGDSSILILGDNLFYGNEVGDRLKKLDSKISGAHIFTYPVANPSEYGVLSVDQNKKPSSIIEKPVKPDSNLAVTGLYFFDHKSSELARRIKPSDRGELEITSLIDFYLQSEELTYTTLGRGHAWLDTGSPKALHDASTFIRIIEERTGLKIACLEEIAYQNRWISSEDLRIKILAYKNNDYATYLSKIH